MSSLWNIQFACVVSGVTCACQVCPTGDGRGNGAFAAKHIPAGAYLGDYEGERLDEAAYWARYPSGVVCAYRKPYQIPGLHLHHTSICFHIICGSDKSLHIGSCACCLIA